MRESFESELHAYNDAIKEEAEGKSHASVERHLDQLERQIDRKEQTTLGAQKEIVDLQRQKRGIMERLHTTLEAIGDPMVKERQMAGARLARHEAGQFFVKAKGGIMPVTFGDMVTDADWGFRYALDPETVPRNLRKQYAVALARHDIAELADLQIAINDQKSGKVDYAKQRTYSNIEDERKSKELQFGHIAERMVQNFLMKLSIDHPQLAFKVERADVELDVVDKIDFIIHVTKRSRGVTVETTDAKDAGIQFTLNSAPENIEKKSAQISHVLSEQRESLERLHVSDIIIVTIPTRDFSEAYNHWHADKTPGGPDKLWDAATKKKIFTHVLSGLLPEDDIREQWDLANAQPEMPQEETIAEAA